jgi:hypothetical protein
MKISDIKRILSRSGILLSGSLLLLCSSCSDTWGDSPGGEGYVSGSRRDLNYTGSNVHVYVDGVENTQVSELRMRSQVQDAMVENPRFTTYLNIKGLVKKNKVSVIEVESTNDSFEGTTTYKGAEYVVTGEFVGDSWFDDFSKLGIIVYLNKE